MVARSIEHNANNHLENFRLIIWTDGTENQDLKKYIDENELRKIEIKHYKVLSEEPECHGFDKTDEEIIQFIKEELTHQDGNPAAASDMFRLLALKHLGGFYSDVNDEPPYILNDSQTLIPSSGCWVGGEDVSISNNLLAAVKNNPLIRETLIIIAANYKEKGVQFIFDERKIDRWNPIAYSGPIALGKGIKTLFGELTFFNRKRWNIGLTKEGKKLLQIRKQKFFYAANKEYRTGTDGSWIKSDFAHERPVFLFNDAEINAYKAKLSAK